MSSTINVLCFCTFLSTGLALAPLDEKHTVPDTSSPLEFPKQSDLTTPILFGNNPLSGHLPPRMFPTRSPSDHNSTDPPILSITDANITEIKHNNQEAILNHTLGNITKTMEKSNSSVVKVEKPVIPFTNVEKLPAEQDDMLHSRYKGGQDVDELLKPDKKATEKDEKKTIEKDEKKASEMDEKKITTPKKDPNTDIDIIPNFDKKGPKLMNETKTKSGESMLESTSKMMAVSSSVLSSTKARHRHNGIIDPAKTVVSVLLSVAVVLCFGVIGFLVWKKIAMRRFGRDVLINEDDFDEVSDMHTFDSAQIQIT